MNSRIYEKKIRAGKLITDRKDRSVKATESERDGKKKRGQ